MTTVMTERRAIRLDGQLWVLEAAGTPVHWKNELCVQVMMRDITARKKTQEEVARLNRELRAINECDQVIVHSHDEQTLYPMFAASCVRQQVTAWHGLVQSNTMSQISAPLGLVR